MAGTGGFIFGASPKANNETRSLASPPSSLTSGKKTSPTSIIDRGFNQSTNSPSPVVSSRRPFKFGPRSSAVEKVGPLASQFAFNCDYSTPASAMPHSMYGLDRSKKHNRQEHRLRSALIQANQHLNHFKLPLPTLLRWRILNQRLVTLRRRL